MQQSFFQLILIFYGGVFLSNFYPISLNLNNKLCIVVGGGNVALRRVYKLLEAGAIVQVLSPTIKAEFQPLLEAHLTLSWTKAHYIGPQDLKEASLVFATTNNPSVNLKVWEDANSLGIFANIASNGELSDFIIPSSFNQGDLQVSISTSGKVPGLSKAVKENIKDNLGPEYESLIHILEHMRHLAIADSHNKTENLYSLSTLTNNYESILKDLSLGIDPLTIQNQLLNLLK